MENTDKAKYNLITNKVNIYLDVLGPLMMHQNGREIEWRNIVTVHKSGAIRRAAKSVSNWLSQEVSTTDWRQHDIQPRHWNEKYMLGVRGPRDQIVTQIDTVASCRETGIRTTAPVSI